MNTPTVIINCDFPQNAFFKGTWYWLVQWDDGFASGGVALTKRGAEQLANNAIKRREQELRCAA